MKYPNGTSIFNLDKPTPLVQLMEENSCAIYVKREDLNHPIIQGNKLRKLKYNIQHAKDNNCNLMVTFGGAYSNHIVATAQAAQLSQLKSTGFIRGDELENSPEKWSQTLIDAQNFGMQLVFLSRKEYRLKEQAQRVKKYLSNQENVYIIPEGGSNKLALSGVAEIIDEIRLQMPEPSHIITACGTGGTCAGLIDGVAIQGWQTKVIGIPVLKGAQFLIDDIKKISSNHQRVNWQLYFDYHAGGYAKLEKRFYDFAKNFRIKTNIPLDKIYNAKSFYAAYDLINKGEIKAGSHIVIVHTGGLQAGVV